MDTATAAAQAGVTTDTIRTWCRIGAVAAVKTGGRWGIDEASLAYRISLTAKPKTLSIDTMLAIGGSRWTKAGRDRVYLNNWAQYAGLETSHYNTGNVSSATLGGHAIANGRVAGILGSVSKVYFDAEDGKLHAQHFGADNYEVRFLDGSRVRFDFVAEIFAGVRAAVAAL